ncbi:unnamed protein product [Acanthosepion pharaonis]|uniref:Uncharacterized protein n=1 Tax=Acanthosepion pharaonis TaxID=158019 RepID=A0A812CDN9_ACAPH|nr:unnamed protein product [Sepia pharaonis]
MNILSFYCLSPSSFIFSFMIPLSIFFFVLPNFFSALLCFTFPNSYSFDSFPSPIILIRLSIYISSFCPCPFFHFARLPLRSAFFITYLLLYLFFIYLFFVLSLPSVFYFLFLFFFFFSFAFVLAPFTFFLSFFFTFIFFIAVIFEPTHDLLQKKSPFPIILFFFLIFSPFRFPLHFVFSLHYLSLILKKFSFISLYLFFLPFSLFFFSFLPLTFIPFSSISRFLVTFSIFFFSLLPPLFQPSLFYFSIFSSFLFSPSFIASLSGFLSFFLISLLIFFFFSFLFTKLTFSPFSFISRFLITFLFYTFPFLFYRLSFSPFIFLFSFFSLYSFHQLFIFLFLSPESNIPLPVISVFLKALPAISFTFSKNPSGYLSMSFLLYLSFFNNPSCIFFLSLSLSPSLSP